MLVYWMVNYSNSPTQNLGPFEGAPILTSTSTSQPAQHDASRTLPSGKHTRNFGKSQFFKG